MFERTYEKIIVIIIYDSYTLTKQTLPSNFETYKVALLFIKLTCKTLLDLFRIVIHL